MAARHAVALRPCSRRASRALRTPLARSIAREAIEARQARELARREASACRAHLGKALALCLRFLLRQLSPPGRAAVPRTPVGLAGHAGGAERRLGRPDASRRARLQGSDARPAGRGRRRAPLARTARARAYCFLGERVERAGAPAGLLAAEVRASRRAINTSTCGHSSFSPPKRRCTAALPSPISQARAPSRRRGAPASAGKVA